MGLRTWRSNEVQRNAPQYLRRAAVLLLAAPLVGASSGNEPVQADPLVIDIATGTVSEANGTPIATDRRSAGSDGELIEGTTPTQLADSGDLELTSITAVTPTTLSYAWVGGGDSHAIYRDGKLVETSDSASFTESGLGAGSTYTYEV